ncbi:MAG: protein translocase subunit SecD [Candidatus Omnitrophica bacterium]|nr:protein translocase subunit SecD [Candidatus Omnitrophota bacterium]
MEKRFLYKVWLILFVVGLMAFYAFPLQKRINLGLDLKGGMHLLLRVDTSNLSPEAKHDAVERAVEVLRSRIDEFGVREPIIQKHGRNEIVVQLPGITDHDRALALIKRTAFLEFKLVSDEQDKLKEVQAGNIPEGFELKYTQDEQALLLKKKAVLTGDAIKNAFVRFDSSRFGQPIVSLEFNPQGAQAFAEITKNNIGTRLAIVLDGKVQSAPVIREEIPSGEAVISGSFTLEKAQDLSLVLRVGALPTPIVLEEERTVGPLLGQDSIYAGLKATIIGMSLIFLFMFLYYGLTGLVVNIALLLNLLFIFGGLGILPTLFRGISPTLTLPGIAGIILSLGMAVDANILVNERMREEAKLGRPILSVINNGYNKALSAIIDSNITTLIAAFLLFQFGTGPIRGFAVTLTIGLLSSMFTALIVSRTILEFLVQRFGFKTLHLFKLIKETHIDFIAKRRIFYAISILIIVFGLIALKSRGVSNLGIDFTGGQIYEYRFSEPMPIDELRRACSQMTYMPPSITQFKNEPNLFLIKTKEEIEDFTGKLRQAFPYQKIEISRIEQVGPVAGRHLRGKAGSSLIWTLVGILIYITIRFRHINFAVAGIIALFHDALITLGFVCLANRQIDLLFVTAILTIIGYSINDTIVVYDRVRENAKLYPKLKPRQLMNLSINQTLSRTILTTFTTLMVIVALLFWGGKVLNNFAFALFVGFISGCYSTIFIASPLVLVLRKRRQATF